MALLRAIIDGVELGETGEDRGELIAEILINATDGPSVGLTAQVTGGDAAYIYLTRQQAILLGQFLALAAHAKDPE